MYDVGDKVVCVEDNFEPFIYELYEQLPDKGVIYTVRALDLGRSNLIPGKTITSYRVLLEELRNPIDPLARAVQEELGFGSHRFAPVEEASQEEELMEYHHNPKELAWKD